LRIAQSLGLLSEESEPTLQRQIRNFTQAFSHLALILTAQIITTKSAREEADLPIHGTGTACLRRVS
jgi:hypothetical protein